MSSERVAMTGSTLTLTLLLVLSGSPGALTPQEPVQPHPEAEEAISRLRSPYCPGLMLEVCPSPGGEALRDSLRDMAHQGIEADSLVAWTLARHGEEWRATPQAEGFGIWAWVMPPLVLIVGVLGVWVALRRLKGGEAGGERPPEPALSEEDEARVAAALGEMDEE